MSILSSSSVHARFALTVFPSPSSHSISAAAVERGSSAVEPGSVMDSAGAMDALLPTTAVAIGLGATTPLYM